MIFPRGPGFRGISFFGPRLALCHTIRDEEIRNRSPENQSLCTMKPLIIAAMIRLKSTTFLAALLLLVLDQSCVSDDFPSYTCTGDPVSYESGVHPIIMSKCAVEGCHGSDPDLPNWTVFTTFQQEARTGHVKEYVINRIMPPADSPEGPLSQEQVALIACWVDQGAEDN